MEAVPGELTLSGRVFQQLPDRMTFEREMFVSSHLMAAGLHKLSLDQVKDQQDAGVNIIVQAYESGKLFHILAGLLEEKGKPWTRESAEENAHFLAELTAPEDKTKLRQMMAVSLLAFFVSGEIASLPSLTSSQKSEKVGGAVLPLSSATGEISESGSQ